VLLSLSHSTTPDKLSVYEQRRAGRCSCLVVSDVRRLEAEGADKYLPKLDIDPRGDDCAESANVVDGANASATKLGDVLGGVSFLQNTHERRKGVGAFTHGARKQSDARGYSRAKVSTLKARASRDIRPGRKRCGRLTNTRGNDTNEQLSSNTGSISNMLQYCSQSAELGYQ
jgi:hypothetical protein